MKHVIIVDLQFYLYSSLTFVVIYFVFLAECDGTGEPNVEEQVSEHILVIITIILLHGFYSHMVVSEPLGSRWIQI